MIVCASCRHENETGVLFCDECGDRLALTATVAASAIRGYIADPRSL